jgi:hypothetical protein
MTLADHSPFRDSFVEAYKRGFPPLLDVVAKSTMSNASPYVCSVAEFSALCGVGARRKELSDVLQRALADLLSRHAEVVGLLVGGSFIDTQVVDPGDLDCVCFYRASEGFRADEMSGLTPKYKHLDLDIRFIPADSDPLLLIKAAAFFTLLYTARRGGEPSRGTILVAY